MNDKQDLDPMICTEGEMVDMSIDRSLTDNWLQRHLRERVVKSFRRYSREGL